ncbi:MAG: tetratricopeptide repeat protein [Terracidiphilus sp.]
MKTDRMRPVSLFAAATLPFVFTTILLLPPSLQAQSPPKGIDPKLLTKAAAGDASSQTAVGLAYAGGDGVPQDYAKAAEWLGKAADQDNAIAQAALGLLYYAGRGVPKDYNKAAILYRRAAEQGISKAQLSLGNLYLDGQGVPVDYGQAMAWFRKAADQGDAEAEYSLALLYDDGKGVPQDTAQAITWYRKAAEQGLSFAQINLGLILFANAGDRQRAVEEAYFWLDVAAARTNDSHTQQAASKARDEVASQLLPFQLKRTQKKAETWIVEHPTSALTMYSPH